MWRKCYKEARQQISLDKCNYNGSDSREQNNSWVLWNGLKNQSVRIIFGKLKWQNSTSKEIIANVRTKFVVNIIKCYNHCLRLRQPSFNLFDFNFSKCLLKGIFELDKISIVLVSFSSLYIKFLEAEINFERWEPKWIFIILSVDVSCIYLFKIVNRTKQEKKTNRISVNENLSCIDLTCLTGSWFGCHSLPVSTSS